MRRRKFTMDVLNVNATTALWTCVVYLFFVAICTCNDATEPIQKTSTPSSKWTTLSNHTKASAAIASAELRRIRMTTFNNITRPQNQQNKRTFVRSGNELWDSLIDECLAKPSFSCFQKNVYTYLDNTLKLDDVNVTDRIQFKKIDIDPNTLLAMQNDTSDDDDNDISDDGRAFESESPIEEVTDALYGKWRSFMMSHSVTLKMPEMMFDGATFRISPRSFEGDGALIKIEMIPNAVEARGGRILFKKIKKFLKNKLLLSFLAIVLVIKLIKIKLFWVLPLIIGVGAAKKLILKFILFLFPALAHLFKLCSYYHKNYHDTKYHHHHHQINHLHTVVPPWYKEYADHHGRPSGFVETVHLPPKGHPAEYIHSLPNPHQQQPHYPPASVWPSAHPSGLGSEYITDIHRNSYQPKADDSETLNSWGLSDSDTIPKQHDNNINSVYLEPQPSTFATGQLENSIVRTPLSNSRTPTVDSYANYEPSSQLNYGQNDKFAIADKIQQALRQPTLPTAQNLIAADPFYGPIVIKIESILQQYSGYLDDNCKEWLICNMYKDPARFSPHSNFLSAELSRDSSELQKPAALNVAVLTFYKYVKAARDGQDQKDCFTLNPKCSVH